MIFVSKPSTTTLVIPVRPGREAELLARLEAAGAAKDTPMLRALASLRKIHFARFVLLPVDDGFGALLAFESNHDDSERDHLRALSAALGDELEALLCHCVSYEATASSDRRARFLARHALSSITPYRGHPSLSVERVGKDLELRAAVASFVREETKRGRLQGDPSAIHAAIAAHVAANHHELTQGAPRRRLPSMTSFALVLTALALFLSGTSAGLIVWAWDISAWWLTWLGTLAGLLVLVGVLYLGFGEWVRGVEDVERCASDQKRTRAMREPDRGMKPVFWREDRQVQNALTHVALVKPSADREAILWVILTAVRLLAAMLYTRGKLGSIDSIHCARWVPIDGGKRLLFFSNYDGSWESYLGEFVDKLPFWLTAVWSNTQDFPTTRNRFESDGARDEEWFKRWTRARQHHTQVWYAAYPNTSVQNVNDNAALREGLGRKLADGELRAWLRLI